MEPDTPYPRKGHGTRDTLPLPKGPVQGIPYPLPCGQTNTCENIAFLQLRWRLVMKQPKCQQPILGVTVAET